MAVRRIKLMEVIRMKDTRKWRHLKILACMGACVALFMAMTWTCLGSGSLQDTPLGEALDKLDNGRTEGASASWRWQGSAQGSFVGEGSSVSGSLSTGGSGEVSGSSPAAPSSPVPSPLTLPSTGEGVHLPSPSIPSSPEGLPEPGDLLSPDSFSRVLDPSNLSTLLPSSGNLPWPETLPGILDPSAFPGLEGLPGVDGIISNLPAPPSGSETPSLPTPGSMPEDLLRIIEKSDHILVLVSIDDLIEAKVALGKDLEKAPLLQLHLILFKALAAKGKLGLKKVSDDAFLVPLEFYLKYWAGDQGWKEILNILLPLEISFPGAGMLPEGIQNLLDNLYEKVLKPLLPLLPIYEAENPPSSVQPSPEEGGNPPVEVGGVVVSNPSQETPTQETGSLGDHLPFTGAELALLMALIVILSASSFLLRSAEKRMRKRLGRP